MMPTWKKLLIGFGIALLSGALWFPALMFALTATEKCPPRPNVCDIGAIGAFGLAVTTTPLVALLAGWYAYRRLGRKGTLPRASSELDGLR